MLITFEGTDGSGKSTVVKTVAETLRTQGKKIFDVAEWSKANHDMPFGEEIEADVILVSEPSLAWVGSALRKELFRNRTSYNGEDIAHALSLDRLMQFKRVVIPLLERGKTVIQDRSMGTMMVYQPVQKNSVPLEYVLNLPGNKLAMQYPPQTMVIVSCTPENAIARLNARTDKKDDTIFEKLPFIVKTYERYHAPWFREHWEKLGTKMHYFDANVPFEDMKRNAAELVKTLSL